MKHLFDMASIACSKTLTTMYSTSFSLAIKMLAPEIRPAIYAIYGFVRSADEIVDSFHDYNQGELLHEFEEEYYKSLERKISLNPILNAFQEVVHLYQIQDLVPSFLKSMRMDLYKNEYTTEAEINEYIYGSADVVGLMCLKVFVHGDENQYNALKDSAMKLGSAFQKVNFLRDLKDDTERLGRIYFPTANLATLNSDTKHLLVKDIENDFAEAYEGILRLPDEAKFGVYMAYRYYSSLLNKINSAEVNEMTSQRIRVSNFLKVVILGKSFIRYRLNLI